MASFNTHVTVGVVASGVVASGALIAGLTQPGETFVYAALGAFGSILPDIDADNSIPTRIGTGLLSIVLAFTAVFLLAKNLPLSYLVGVWIITFLLMRFLLFPFLTNYTKHRGLFHSIPTAVLLGLLTTVISARLFQQIPQRAWLAGIFISVGYVIHLLLDEMYSIDWAGKRIRRSFGSAFKLGSTANWVGTIAIYLTCFVLYYIGPSPRPLLNAFSTMKIKIYSQHRLRLPWATKASQSDNQNFSRSTT